ncbi:MAG: hypothetical protein WB770_01355 [Acidimicrobiales bacterium]
MAPPAWWRYGLSVGVAVGLSLGADAALVHGGVALFPSTRGFSHFRFSDYATLTCIGVIVGALGWPLVLRVSSAPQWLFLRAAVAVTVVAWAPDVWLVAKGETAKGVAVLAVMHLAVALITYQSLVRLAPARALDDRTERALVEESGPRDIQRVLQAWWVAMVVAVSLEFVLGVISIVAVPFSRPSAWVPAQGRAVFLVHGVFGALLLIGACAVVALGQRSRRIARIASIAGLAAIVLSGGGGLLSLDHSLRLAGMAVMFVGSGIAFFAYLVPLVETSGDEAPDALAAESTSEGDEPALT